MKYNYIARNQKGEMQNGTIEANSESAAIEILQTNKLVVVAIESSEKMSALSRRIKLFEKVNKKEIVIFTRQLSILVASDVPLVQSLRSIAAQIQNVAFREITLQMAADVEGGMLLSKALDKQRKYFNAFYVNLIKSGEASGRMQASLEFLAEHLEKEYHLMARVKRAMYYPLFILSIFLVVMIGMFLFVIPNMIEFLKDFDQDLPLITRVMMAINNFMLSFGWIILLLLIIAGIILFYWNKTSSGRQFFDNLKLNLPIFGKVFRMSYIAHFTKNLSTLVKGGLPIIQALEISGQVSGNVAFAQIIDKAKNEVSKGNTMSSVFMREPLIPPVVSQMIKTGETTGKLDYVLDNLADYYTKEVDYLVDNLSTLIEPVMIVTLGAMVGFLMAAVLLPIYNLTSTL